MNRKIISGLVGLVVSAACIRVNLADYTLHQQVQNLTPASQTPVSKTPVNETKKRYYFSDTDNYATVTTEDGNEIVYIHSDEGKRVETMVVNNNSTPGLREGIYFRALNSNPRLEEYFKYGDRLLDH